MSTPYTLVLGSPLETHERDKLTHPVWGKEFTLDQYLLREERLRDQPWCKKNRKTWLLVQEVLGEGPKPLASCETFEMKSYWNLLEGNTLGIASVFTEPKMRGLGYCSKLIQALIKRVEETSPQCHALVLYSEIGVSLYERLGFKAVKSEEWCFSGLSKGVNREMGDPPIASVIRIERGFDIKKLNLSLKLPQAKFLIWPTEEQLEWHWARQDIEAEYLNRSLPDCRGVRVGESFLLWMVDFKKKALKILVTFATDIQVMEPMLSEAVRYAEALGLPEVRMWVSQENLGLACHTLDFFISDSLSSLSSMSSSMALISSDSVKRVEREDSIAMILPLNSKLLPDDWSSPSRAVWV